MDRESLYRRVIKEIMLVIDGSVETCSADLEHIQQSGKTDQQLFYAGRLMEATEIQALVRHKVKFYTNIDLEKNTMEKTV